MSVLKRRSSGRNNGPRNGRLLVAAALGLAWLGAAYANEPTKAAPPEAKTEAAKTILDGLAADNVLPLSPKNQPEPAPLLGDDLAVVPQISFQEPLGGNTPLTGAQWQQKMAEQIAKINKLNQQETDGFLKLLLAKRADLAGLPTLMGDDCKMPQEQITSFGSGLAILRLSMKKTMLSFNENPKNPNPLQQQDAEAFWNGYKTLFEKMKEGGKLKGLDSIGATRAQIAGLMQVLAPEHPELKKGLVKILADVPHPAATRALARLAVFTPEKSVRDLAVTALKNRNKTDYTDILLAGLRYPWPAVARNAADALLELDRTDLVANLVDMLGEPDPRLPVAKTTGKEDAFEVQQLVKLNHHQNCLMCHPPVDSNTPKEVVKAPMPVPGQPLPSFSSGYGMSGKFKSENDIVVRVDMTYLRQDFSVMQSTSQNHPWPKLQRFDFLVRTLKLNHAQARLFQEKLQPAAGANTPYQDALLLALRGLTGKDAEPTPQAWKQVLKQQG